GGVGGGGGGDGGRGLVRGGGEVGVGGGGDGVGARDRRRLPLVDQVFERKGRGQQAERVQPAAGIEQARGQLVAVPQLRLEVGLETVVDHQARRCKRRHPVDDLGRPAVDVAGIRYRVETALG